MSNFKNKPKTFKLFLTVEFASSKGLSQEHSCNVKHTVSFLGFEPNLSISMIVTLTWRSNRKNVLIIIIQRGIKNSLHSVSSTKKVIDMRLMKAWTAIDKLSIIWKSDLTDKMKCRFFQAVVVSKLLYGCTTWTLTKRLEKKLDGNYTKMLQAILNKSWRQHPTKHQLYGHLPPIMKTIQIRRTRQCWRSRD